MKVYICPDEFALQTFTRNATYATTRVVAKLLGASDLTAQGCAMVVLLNCRNCELPFVVAQFFFQAGICDDKYRIDQRTSALIPSPFEIARDLSKFLQGLWFLHVKNCN